MHPNEPSDNELIKQRLRSTKQDTSDTSSDLPAPMDLAAWLDGNAEPSLNAKVEQVLAADRQLRRYLTSLNATPAHSVNLEEIQRLVALVPSKRTSLLARLASGLLQPVPVLVLSVCVLFAGVFMGQNLAQWQNEREAHLLSAAINSSIL